MNPRHGPVGASGGSAGPCVRRRIRGHRRWAALPQSRHRNDSSSGRFLFKPKVRNAAKTERSPRTELPGWNEGAWKWGFPGTAGVNEARQTLRSHRIVPDSPPSLLPVDLESLELWTRRRFAAQHGFRTLGWQPFRGARAVPKALPITPGGLWGPLRHALMTIDQGSIPTPLRRLAPTRPAVAELCCREGVGFRSGAALDAPSAVR